MVAWNAKMQCFSILLKPSWSTIRISLQFRLVCLRRLDLPSSSYVFHWPFFVCILLQTYSERHGGAFWLPYRNSLINSLRPVVSRLFQDSQGPCDGFVKAWVVERWSPFLIRIGFPCKRHRSSRASLMIYVVWMGIGLNPI